MIESNGLSDGEISRLKASTSDLESSVLRIYSHRSPRELLGDEGILVRTLGANYVGPLNRESQYFDKRRNEYVYTEFSEVLEALDVYDSDPTDENKVELLLEVGDILFQRKIVKLKHWENEAYVHVVNKFDSALRYITNELEKRSVSSNGVKKLAEIKYGSRAWLGVNGYESKNKDLELRLCLEAIGA